MVALVLLFVGLNFLKGLTLFNSSSIYYIVVKDAQGLTRSSKVFLNGVIVGSVGGIEFDYKGLTGTVLKLHLEPELRIPHGTIGFAEDNPMGSTRVRLRSPMVEAGSQFYQEGDTIPSLEQVGLMTAFRENVLPSITQVTKGVDSLVQSLNSVVSNPHLPEMIARLNATSQQVEQAARQLNRMMQQQVPQILNGVDSTVVAVQGIANDVQKAKLQETLTQFSLAATDLREVVAQLKQEDNTMGLLLNDTTLYYNINSVATAADSLLTDIKAHPKRYVKFSLF